jgi:hypothetical protein
MRTRSLPNTGHQRYLLSRFYRYVNEDGYDRLDGIVIMYAVGHGLLVHSHFVRLCMYSYFAYRHVLPLCNSEIPFEQDVKRNVLCQDWAEEISQRSSRM